MSCAVAAEISFGRRIVRPEARLTGGDGAARVFDAPDDRWRRVIVNRPATFLPDSFTSLRHPPALAHPGAALAVPDAAALFPAKPTGSFTPLIACLNGHPDRPGRAHASLHRRLTVAGDHFSVFNLDAVADTRLASPATGRDDDAPATAPPASARTRMPRATLFRLSAGKHMVVLIIVISPCVTTMFLLGDDDFRKSPNKRYVPAIRPARRPDPRLIDATYQKLERRGTSHAREKSTEPPPVCSRFFSANRRWNRGGKVGRNE